MVTLSMAGLEKAMVDTMLQRRRAQLFETRQQQERLLGALADTAQAINRHETEIQHLEALLSCVSNNGGNHDHNHAY